jgi:hypothetical protein
LNFQFRPAQIISEGTFDPKAVITSVGQRRLRASHPGVTAPRLRRERFATPVWVMGRGEKQPLLLDVRQDIYRVFGLRW